MIKKQVKPSLKMYHVFLGIIRLCGIGDIQSANQLLLLEKSSEKKEQRKLPQLTTLKIEPLVLPAESQPSQENVGSAEADHVHKESVNVETKIDESITYGPSSANDACSTTHPAQEKRHNAELKNDLQNSTAVLKKVPLQKSLKK